MTNELLRCSLHEHKYIFCQTRNIIVPVQHNYDYLHYSYVYVCLFVVLMKYIYVCVFKGPTLPCMFSQPMYR